MSRPDGLDGPEYRAQRRALVRRHHPDAGGDAAELREALARLDAAHAVDPGPARAPVEVRRTRAGGAARLARRLTLAVRRATGPGRALLGGRRGRVRYHRID